MAEGFLALHALFGAGTISQSCFDQGETLGISVALWYSAVLLATDRSCDRRVRERSRNLNGVDPRTRCRRAGRRSREAVQTTWKRPSHTHGDLTKHLDMVENESMDIVLLVSNGSFLRPSHVGCLAWNILRLQMRHSLERHTIEFVRTHYAVESDQGFSKDLEGREDRVDISTRPSFWSDNMTYFP